MTPLSIAAELEYKVGIYASYSNSQWVLAITSVVTDPGIGIQRLK
jgi:hypothetical protein